MLKKLLQELWNIINFQNKKLLFMPVKHKPPTSTYIVTVLLNILVWNVNGSGMSLGNNLINNFDFSSPNIPKKSQSRSQKSIKNWNCFYNCEVINLPLICTTYSQFCFSNSSQAINITAPIGSSPQVINQSVSKTVAADYLLQISCLISSNFDSQNILIYVNSILMANFYVEGRNYSYDKIYSQIMSLSAGVTEISIEMTGSIYSNISFQDIMGIYLTSVSLQQILSIANTSNTSVINATLNATIITINSTNPIINSTDNTSIFTPNISIDSNETASNSTQISNETILSTDDLIASAVISAILNNTFASTLNQIPGSRIIGNLLMRFYKNFDRLEFYYFHIENKTIFSDMFLKAISDMQQEKGTLIQAIIQQNTNNSVLCSLLKNGLISLINAANFKKRYVSQQIYFKNQRGDSFVANNLNYFYYELPIIFIVQFLCWLLFRFSFKYSVSLMLRKYCFLGLILMMMFEGNIEQFIFYYLAECRNLFSASFSHKIVNSFIIAFGFLMFFYAFGCILWFYVYYRGKGKYFIEDYQPQLLSYVGQAIQSGIIPIISAFAHSFLYKHAGEATIVLTLMEFGWIIIRIKFLHQKIYLYPFRIYLNIIASVLRILFCISLYLYSLTENIGINTAHFYFIIIYMSIWIIQIIYSILIILRDVAIYLRQKILTTKSRKKQNKKVRKSKTVQIQNIFDCQIRANRPNKVKFKVAFRDIYPIESMDPYNASASNIFLNQPSKISTLAIKFTKNHYRIRQV